MGDSRAEARPPNKFKRLLTIASVAKKSSENGGSQAEAVPPNRLKKFLTIASIAEMGVPGPGRQRSSRGPADKGAAGSGSQPTRGPNRGSHPWTVLPRRPFQAKTTCVHIELRQ